MVDIFKEISSRAENLVLLPLKVSTQVLFAGSVVIGVAACGLSVLTLGTRTQINQQSNLVNAASSILPKLYRYVFSVLNPKVLNLKISPCTGLRSATSDQIFAEARSLVAKEGFFKRHVVSRGAFALGAIVALIAGIMDLMIAVPAVVASTITCGAFRDVNKFALTQLRSFGFISDVCRGARGLVNPLQFGYIPILS